MVAEGQARDLLSAMAVSDSDSILVVGGNWTKNGIAGGAVKYDGNGNVDFVLPCERQYNLGCTTTAVTVDTSGSIYVSGIGGIVKYDREGMRVWAATCNRGGFAVRAIDRSGNVYGAGGVSTGYRDFRDLEHDNFAHYEDQDIMIVKYAEQTHETRTRRSPEMKASHRDGPVGGTTDLLMVRTG